MSTIAETQEPSKNHCKPRDGACAGGGVELVFDPGLVLSKQVNGKTQESSNNQAYRAPLPDENVLLVDSKQARNRKMKSSILNGHRLHTEQAQEGGYRGKWSMLTLTYRNGDEWQPRHVSRLLKHVRDYLATRTSLARFVWVAELQKRGALHYHILIWLPRGITLPKPDKRGWWPHGSTRIEWASKAAGYLAKYCSKGDSGDYPKGARIHGCGGLLGTALEVWRWWKRPKYVRDCEPDPRVKFSRGGGGWINHETGETVLSEWVYSGMCGSNIVFRRRPISCQF